MFGARFYHETTRKYVAMFGTLFNDMQITRTLGDDTTQRVAIPISYAPKQKLLSRLQEDPDLDAPAITLPRMSFEIVGMTYDGERKVTSNRRTSVTIPDNDSSYKTVYTPAPYNIDFELNILTKYTEDGAKILEQIIPYFKPDFTPSVQLIDGIDRTWDVPIILNSINTEDTYEGEYDQRRALVWTLNFTLKGYFFGPVENKKIIKFVQVNMYANEQSEVDANTYHDIVTVQPGLTANGEPTMDINETIPYANINFDDDWAYIVVIKDSEE